MIENIRDDLLISLNNIIQIRTDVLNRIHFFKFITKEKKEELMNFKENFEKPEESNGSIKPEGTLNLNNEQKKHDNISLDQKSSSPNNCNETTEKNLRETEKLRLSAGIIKINVLKSLQMNLKSSLECIEFLKQDIVEKITLINNEKKNFVTEGDKQVSNSPSKKISNETVVIQVDKQCITPTHQNLELKNINSTQLESNSSQVSNGNGCPNNETVTNVKEEHLESVNTSNFFPRTNSSHEKVMISLISDDDSDSDCSVISFTKVDLANVSDNSTTNNLKCLTEKSDNISNQEEQKNPVTTISNNEEKNEFEKRKSNSSEKSPAKKRKIFKENGETGDQTRSYIFGEFYKVKLTNLHESILYKDLATLLKNAGLEFIDILLVNNGSKTYAEVTFTEATSKEKAVSMDKSLTFSGMKIKVKSLEI